MGIRIDGTSDLINATDGSLTIEGQSINTTGIVTAASLVTADKIIHNGDTNTAIRFPSADTFSVETGGSERSRVTSTGNLLVGATAVEDWDGSRDHRIQVRGNTYQTAGISILDTQNDDNSGELVIGKSRGTGNTIVGSADDIGQIRFAANDGAGFHSIAWVRASMDGTPGSDDLPSNLRFGTSADGGVTVSERLRIDSSGRLLLGTTTEGEATADNFTIADSGHCGITLRSGTSSVGTIFFSDSTSGTGEYEGYVQYDHTNNFLKWATGNTERMRLDSGGNLLLGTTTATSELTVRGGGTVAAFEGTGGSSAIMLTDVDNSKLLFLQNADGVFNVQTNGSSYATKLNVTQSGQVGVNTVTFNTGSKLEVSSEGAYGIISRSQNGNGGYHVFTGQSSGGTNTSYITHNGRGYFEDGVQFDSSGEVLDSYEEGTWTPVPENTTNTPTYHNQQGIYTKIGNLVTVVGFIQFNVAPTFSSNDSELRVTGLPFTANGTGYMNTVGNVTFQSLNWSGSTYNDYGAEGNLVCGVVENTKNVFKVNPAGNNLIRGTLRREAFEGGGIITWSMTYKTNS